MFENITDVSIMAPRPDSNTAEAILYGDEYQFYKSAMWWWDAVQHELEKQLQQEISKLRDPEFCLYILERRPNVIWSRQPPFNEIDKIREVRQLREVIRRGTALRDLQVRRAQNEMYAKLKGVDKHVKEIREQGVSETMWMAASSGRNQQIDYEMLREILDDDKLVAEEEAREIGLTLEERRKENERYEREYEEYRKAQKEAMDPNRAMESEDEAEEHPEKPFSIEDVAIFREAEEAARRMEEQGRNASDPNSDEYWDSEAPDIPPADGDSEEQIHEDRVAKDWVCATVHDSIRRDMAGWYMDDMDWFLSVTEAVA